MQKVKSMDLIVPHEVIYSLVIVVLIARYIYKAWFCSPKTDAKKAK